MPYILPERREAALTNPLTIGELNYAITNLILGFGGRENLKSYKDYNELLGVLEAVKMELYRRAIAPYEDEKLMLNGDVYK